jgi:hypothetical protein
MLCAASYICCSTLPSRLPYFLFSMGFIMLIACVLTRRYHNETIAEAYRNQNGLVPIPSSLKETFPNPPHIFCEGWHEHSQSKPISYNSQHSNSMYAFVIFSQKQSLLETRFFSRVWCTVPGYSLGRIDALYIHHHPYSYQTPPKSFMGSCLATNITCIISHIYNLLAHV